MTRTITGRIQITSEFKATNFCATLVNEPNIVKAGVRMTMITPLPEIERSYRLPAS